jgi:predicted sulfurtransferase
MKKNFWQMLPFCLLAALLSYGCVNAKTTPSTPAATEKVKALVYTGKVTGKSNKAKLISLEVGKGAKAKTISIKFDDKTKGVEHASKGHKSIVTYEKRGNEIYALTIKPKLAKLPANTSEISVEDVKALMDKGTDFELIDSRPGARYSGGHLPGAISIPVCEMQELIGLLPHDKDKLLVFYCGGPT